MGLRIHFASAVATIALIGGVAVATPSHAAKPQHQIAAASATPATANEPAATGTQPPMGAEKPADSDKMTGMSEGKGTHSAQIETHIKELHSRLKITKEEEPQWDAVVQVMRENAEAMDNLVKERAEQAKTMSAVDDLKAYGEIAAAHAEGVKKFSAAFQSLYDGMSDAQKKSADALFRDRMREKMGGPHHHPRTAQPG